MPLRVEPKGFSYIDSGQYSIINDCIDVNYGSCDKWLHLNLSHRFFRSMEFELLINRCFHEWFFQWENLQNGVDQTWFLSFFKAKPLPSLACSASLGKVFSIMNLCGYCFWWLLREYGWYFFLTTAWVKVFSINVWSKKGRHNIWVNDLS